MKTLLVAGAVLALTCAFSSSAHADRFYIGIGSPAPVYVAPPPPPVYVQPAPVYYYNGYYYQEPHHYYRHSDNWRYWQHDRGRHEGDRHDHDRD